LSCAPPCPATQLEGLLSSTLFEVIGANEPERIILQLRRLWLINENVRSRTPCICFISISGIHYADRSGGAAHNFTFLSTLAVAKMDVCPSPGEQQVVINHGGQGIIGKLFPNSQTFLIPSWRYSHKEQQKQKKQRDIHSIR